QFRVSVAAGLSADEINHWAQDNNIIVLDQRALRYGMIEFHVHAGEFNTLIHTPWISFINTIPLNEEINYRGIHAERGWALISSFGRGLNGTGMTVGIGDGGRVEVHEDLSRD